jgi:hypothetical protein
MSEEEVLIERFEAGQIAADSFHHADHVRLAFAYLNTLGALDALGRFSAALKRFAEAQGKAERYNETITYAYFFLIRGRLARGNHSNWEEFVADNGDLFSWKNGILDRYYNEPTLKSDLARRIFLFPDKF